MSRRETHPQCVRVDSPDITDAFTLSGIGLTPNQPTSVVFNTIFTLPVLYLPKLICDLRYRLHATRPLRLSPKTCYQAYVIVCIVDVFHTMIAIAQQNHDFFRSFFINEFDILLQFLGFDKSGK